MTAPSPSAPPTGLVFADVPNRVIAFILDAIILGIIGVLVSAILGGMGLSAGTLNPDLTFSVNPAGVLVQGIVNLAISAAYFIYTWTTMKASPGQRILNLMTVNESDGSALTQSQAITRYLYMFAPGFIAGLASQYLGGGLGLILSLAGLAWTIYLLYTTANDPKRQGYHDKQAHSVVVKRAAA